MLICQSRGFTIMKNVYKPIKKLSIKNIMKSLVIVIFFAIFFLYSCEISNPEEKIEFEGSEWVSKYTTLDHLSVHKSLLFEDGKYFTLTIVVAEPNYKDPEWDDEDEEETTIIETQARKYAIKQDENGNNDDDVLEEPVLSNRFILKGEYTIDDSHNPKHINFIYKRYSPDGQLGSLQDLSVESISEIGNFETIYTFPPYESVSLGIYNHSGHRLELAISQPGSIERPTQFSGYDYFK